MPLYLVKLINNTLNNFRFAELDACLEFLRVEPRQAYDRPANETSAASVNDGASPYIIVTLPSEAVARALQARCIMADRVVELWGHGTHYAALVASFSQLSPEFTSPYLATDRSWSLVVEGTRRTLTMAEQDAARWKVVRALPFAGRIQLKNPDQRYWLSEDYAHPDDAAPRHVYFGRELMGSVRARELVGLGDLKRRAYLGPTSLDNEVALLMASFAFVRPGAVVLDPFVGTGSILIACAQFRAQLCVGTDIDIRVLRGKNGRNVFSNFAQYNLPPPELVRSDNALHQGGHGHFRTLVEPLYDAVVCDPPYGIRAGARRSGSRREEVTPVPDHLRADHIPQTRPYPVNDVMQDLLAMSAAVLKPHGRLVYLLPVDLSPDAPPPPDPLIPEHPEMELVCVVDQVLNSKLIRKMIVMRRRGRGEAGDGERGEGEREQKRHCA